MKDKIRVVHGFLEFETKEGRMAYVRPQDVELVEVNTAGILVNVLTRGQWCLGLCNKKHSAIEIIEAIERAERSLKSNTEIDR